MELIKLNGAKVEFTRDKLKRSGEIRSLEQFLYDVEQLRIPCRIIASMLSVPVDTIHDWRGKMGFRRREWKKVKEEVANEPKN